MSFGEKCGFLRLALSWCYSEFLVSSDCNGLREDPVLASQGGGSVWLIWEHEPGYGAIACPAFCSVWLPSFPSGCFWGKVLLGSCPRCLPCRCREGLPSCVSPSLHPAPLPVGSVGRRLRSPNCRRSAVCASSGDLPEAASVAAV